MLRSFHFRGDELFYRRIVLLISVAIVFFSQLPTNANLVADEMYKVTPEPGLGYLGYSAFPVGNEVDASPGLVGMQTDSEKKVRSISFCSSIDDPRCAKADYFQFISSLGMCSDIKQLNCISDIFAQKNDGSKLDVKMTDVKFNLKNKYAGNVSVGLPSGFSPPVVEIPGAPHSNGITYLPLVTGYGSWDKAAEGRARIENANLSFYAVKIQSGNYPTSEISDDASNYFQRSWRSTKSAGTPCIFNDSTLCAVATAIPSDLKLGLEVRVDEGIQGWFHGRIEDPDVSFQEDKNGYKIIRILARPTRVPSISVWKKKSELSEDLRKFYTQAPKPLGGSGTGAGNLDLQNGPEEKWSLMRQNNTGFGALEMSEFLTWLPSIGDKANFFPSVWNLKLMTNYNNAGNFQNCQSNVSGLVGVVSTNATQYLSGPPNYNESTNELEYKVAAPHLTPAGEVFRGTYDLSLRSSVAKCLYGITGTAFKVSISVVSAGGELIDASSTVTEKDGWFYFSARGFTFSAPTIKVKLVPEVEKTADSTTKDVVSSPTPKQSVAQKKTITCVKAKSSKKITGINPKCPLGFRKK